MSLPEEDLLGYYWQELLWLRRAGEEFARAYPKVAARLELQADECPDPHVERLIESFAFLTARIQRNLDNDFPEIAAELLGILYPHLVQPTPSLTIARFKVDPDRGKLTSGAHIPAGTRLFAKPEEGAVCRWRTCYPVTLWPIDVTAATIESPDAWTFLDDRPQVASVLRLRLTCRADPFEALELDRLRVYLHGDSLLASRLWDLVFHHTVEVALLPEGREPPSLLPASCLEPVGFGLGDALLPYPPTAQPAYRLLQEYFALPEKHHFFDLTGLARRLSGREADVLLLLDHREESRLHLAASNFLLGATPIVNLFPLTSEPLRIDQRQLSYRLVADHRRERTTGIHSIVSVSGSSDPAEGGREICPFYAYTHDLAGRGQKAFWHAKRVPAVGPGVSGTDLMLSFLDLDFRPSRPPEETVFAHLLCSNRALAEEMPAGALLDADEPLPVAHVTCLKKPTSEISPPTSGQTLWRLVSHLSLNYLSFESDAEAIKALRELLRLYAVGEDNFSQRQVAGLRALSVRPVVRRLGTAAWRGFVKGHEVRVTVEEGLFVGGSPLLLGAVLRHFFALYASTNSFTQLVLESHEREGEWQRWPPLAGEKRFL